ncbi:MAG: nucleotidyltransferase domain-containing protein [Candidatus Bathyarchaeia archaeon]
MPLVEQLLREVLRRKGSRIKFASIFGSYGREEAGRFSDLDILVVCEDGADKTAISNDLARLGSRIKRDIHVNIFTSKSFDERIRNRDYLIASILDDSRFIFGDEDMFFKQKRRILRGSPSIESIEFNRKIGLKILHRTTDALQRFLLNPLPDIFEAGNMRNNVFLKCLRDHHVGLGYLFASTKMNQMNKAMTLRQILGFDDAFILRDLILKEKETIQGTPIEIKDVRNLLHYSRRLLMFQNVLS